MELELCVFETSFFFHLCEWKKNIASVQKVVHPFERCVLNICWICVARNGKLNIESWIWLDNGIMRCVFNAPVTKQFITHFRLNNNRTVTAVTKATTNEQNGMYIGSQLTHSHRVWQGLPGANWWDKHIRTRLDYVCELWRVQHVPSMKYVSKCSKWIYADRVYHILSANQLCARLILQMNFISLHFYQGLDSGNGWK